MPAIQNLPRVLKHIYVLLIVVIGFVLFNAQDIAQAGRDLAGMFGFGGLPLVTAETLYYLRSYGVLFVLSIVGSMPVMNQLAGKLPEKTAEMLQLPVMIGLLLICTAYLVDGSFNPFLYFRF